MAKKKKTRSTNASRKKRSTRRKAGRRPSISKASTAELQRELERRERLLGSMQARRDRLAADLEAVEAEIAALEGRGARRGRPRKNPVGRPRKKAGRKATTRKRPRNKSNLVDALAKTLKGKTMGVSDAAAAVQKAGYKTSSANFRTIVNQTLIGKKGVFKKVSRGKYTAK